MKNTYYYLFCWETDKDKRTLEVSREKRMTREEISKETAKQGTFLNDKKVFDSGLEYSEYKWIALTDIKIIKCD